MSINGEDPAIVASRFLHAKGMTGEDGKVASGHTSLSRQRARAQGVLNAFTSWPSSGTPIKGSAEVAAEIDSQHGSSDDSYGPVGHKFPHEFPQGNWRTDKGGCSICGGHEL